MRATVVTTLVCSFYFPIAVQPGTHGGRDLSELVERDPAYCQWILRTAKDVHLGNPASAEADKNP